MKNSRKLRRARQNLVGWETLEGRVVLSTGGTSSLLDGLTHVGVVTSPIVIPLPIIVPPMLPVAFTMQNFPWGQLESDVKALETELQSLAAKSGVTIADLQSLTSDSQTIAQDGFQFHSQTLGPVISELATAVAGGASTTQASSDFTALFTGPSVPTSVIDTTFSDLVMAIQDSKVTTTDLSTVASDEAAIQTDLSHLPAPFIPAFDGFLNLDPPTPIAVSVPPVAVSVPPDAVSVPPIAVSVPPNIFVPPIIVVPPIPLPPPIFTGPFGATGLLGSLTYVGVVTSPVAVFNHATPVPSSSASGFSQLEADVQKLQSELQTLAAKSGVTIADLQSLTSDGQAISQAGPYFNSRSLNPVISELAAAVAGGSSTTAALRDFTALFNGSSVSASVISTTFSDLVKAIQDSKVTPADLSTVAGDEVAIQTDLKNLHLPKTGGTGTGSGTPGSGTTGSGSTGSSKGNGHHHTNHPTSHVVAHRHSAARSHAIEPELRKKR